MKTKTKEVYYCEHCKKHGLSKHKMEYHEKMCYKNPENIRPCYDCVFFGKKETISVIEHYNGTQDGIRVDIFHCMKKDVFLVSPITVKKGNEIEHEEISERMPTKCEHYKSFLNDRAIIF